MYKKIVFFFFYFFKIGKCFWLVVNLVRLYNIVIRVRVIYVLLELLYVVFKIRLIFRLYFYLNMSNIKFDIFFLINSIKLYLLI